MKNLLYIGNKLSQHGVSVTTIETLGPLLEDEGYMISYASSKKNILLRMLDMFLKVVKSHKKVDLVLIDTYSTSSFWYAFLISQQCRVLRLRYIPLLHGGNLPNRLKKNPRLCKILFGNAFKNIAPSKYLLYHFNQHGFSNTVFIPNTLEIDNYSFKERKGIVPNLLWVRSFAKIYNPNMAVLVFKLIKEKYSEATLCMIGPDKDGSLSEVKMLADRYDLNVIFTGKLSKKEWIALSAGYSIFINTTHFDNTPVSVMEAMALGLPIVSTNVGGIPYLLEDGVDALLTDANDSNAMAEAVLRIIDNVLLRNHLIENARQKAQTWDWKRVRLLWKEVLK